MKACCRNRSRPALSRRILDSTAWLVPATVLAVVPKCPVCLALYVALWTGVGLSIGAATYLRIAILTVSLAMFAYLISRRIRRFVEARG